MFGPRNDEKRSAAIRNIKVAARLLFEADEDDAVVVNELRCTEPGCPPIETVVALLRAGSEPRQIRVYKPVAEVSEDDLREAIRGHGGHAHEHDDDGSYTAQNKVPRAE
jgi:hypothetical protein